MTRRLAALVAAIALLVTAVAPSMAGVRPAAPAASPDRVASIPGSATDPTKIPHYFGPYPNWANSPQVLADAIVTITPAAGDTTGTGAEATATVDPATGGITAVTVTVPGSGYTANPDVAITAAGVTPTSLASAQTVLANGVVTSIAVAEAGFGFTTPSVAITPAVGDVTGAGAVAQASGGVDNVVVTSGGLYDVQPIVEFSLPDLAGGVQAIGTATLAGAIPQQPVVSVTVVNPGSGYTSAPTVTIWDGAATQVAPTPAVAAATIGVGQIDITNGGAGYTAAPTVTITDSVAPFDKNASAVATVAAAGAVSAINVTAPGAGYITPGLKKFVDTLAGLGSGAPNNLGNYIPVAVPDTTTYPGDDYYEIGLVQYRHQFATGLPPALMRGYVQLSTSVVPGAQVALSNASLDPAGTAAPITGYTGVDNPHYLGPTIVATKNKPVRILFRNLLPTGQGGNLFLPVDTSIMGSGPGPNAMMLDANGVPMDMTPDLGTVLDGVRNPACGETPKPANCFSENRATLHLHGGVTPWISDGTPHQWITPAGESTDYPQGVSVSNVPDMNVCGAADDGCQTFYYTNQQSARLMFYHDHAWGITRLNVYAGEAAGYLLTDDTSAALIAPGGALDGLGIGTPLIIQDKTFVPSDAKMAQLDPTWDKAKWGGEGSLWTPHVYMPAQNPGDPSGMSAFGRWMYGPWFWPPAKDAKFPPIDNPYFDPTCDPNVQPFCEPALIPSTPNVSVGMEAFNDTPIVNGVAYPKTSVDPKAYRYLILNAANDRFWNLSWYVADPRTGTLSEVALNPAEVAAAQTDPNVFPTPDTAFSPAGPNWIQIATEGGFLPTPNVIPAHPTTWITDPTRFDVGNVDEHSLLLAPDERADVIVDFSQYRGKTLILYNDAPAAFPARVSSYDYYTGGPDLSPAGAPSTLAGYGPNTRTIMQVTVSSAAPAVAFDRPNTTADRLGTLNAAFAHHLDASGNPAGVFESGSDPIIVGQAAYNTAYGTNFVAAGWCNSPSRPTARCDGFARIAEGSQPTDLFGFNTLLGPSAKMQIPFQPIGMHDEMNSANFDEWGRMTANIGREAPGATPLLQNITLYPYVNPATEMLDATGLPSSLNVTPIASAADGTQIWKITHNGVDTHPIHWHMFNVQVLNRVTWDNIIIPPDPGELGWKDTIRISPLEDTIVAVRPIVPTLPFELPNSIRPLNPMMPIGATGDPNTAGLEAGFNNTDVLGNPVAPIVNQLVNYAMEYVFHCHILSHEEMDMMRPMSAAVAPIAPSGLATSLVTVGKTQRIQVSWTDNSLTETSFVLQRSTNGTTWTDVGTSPSPLGLPNIHGPRSLTDATSVATTPYLYRVVAINAVGYQTDFPTMKLTSTSATVGVNAPAAPTNLTATLQAGPQVSLTWRDNAVNESNFVVERSLNGGAFAQIAIAPARNNTGNVTFVDTTAVAAATPTAYAYRVAAVNIAGNSAYSNTASVALPAMPAAPTSFTAVNGPNGNGNSRSVILTWTDNSANETGFTIQRATNAAFTAGLNTANVGANVVTLTQTGLSRNTTYFYRIRANNGAFVSSAWVNLAPPSITTNL